VFKKKLNQMMTIHCILPFYDRRQKGCVSKDSSQ
jgi:hypothetical protein